MKKKRIPQVRYIDLEGGGNLMFCQYQGDVLFPSIVVQMKQEEAKPLAERSGIDFIRLKNGICLFPSKWLAAVKPQIADGISTIRGILMRAIAEESAKSGPNQ